MSATSERSVRTARSSCQVETATLANTTAPTNSPSRISPAASRATIMMKSVTLKKVRALARTTSRSRRWREASALPSPAASRSAASASSSPGPGAAAVALVTPPAYATRPQGAALDSAANRARYCPYPPSMRIGGPMPSATRGAFTVGLNKEGPHRGPPEPTVGVQPAGVQ